MKNINLTKTLLLTVWVLWLSACVSIPNQQILLGLDKNHQLAQSDGLCNLNKLPQSNDQTDSQAKTLNAEHISLLNWNVYKGQRESWATDFAAFSDGYDIVTIQEAYLNNQLSALLADKKWFWQLNAAFYYNDIESGVMTASKIQPIYTCALRISEPLIRIPKTSLISRYQIAGSDQNLLVANIHAINFSIGIESYAQQIKILTENLAQHDGPIIVAGDFNTWSDVRMQSVNDMVSALFLNGLAYTNHNRTSVLGNAIDHVFYRGLIPTTYEVKQVTSSDHNPITVTFRLDTTAKKLAAI